VEDKLPVTTRIREPDPSTLDSRKGSVAVDPERFRRHLDAIRQDAKVRPKLENDVRKARWPIGRRTNQDYIVYATAKLMKSLTQSLVKPCV
jgi:hypothetical protein